MAASTPYKNIHMTYDFYCFEGFLKLFNPNDENKICLDHTLLLKKHSSKLKHSSRKCNSY